MVSVAVLMSKSSFLPLGGATGADAVNGNLVVVHLEALRAGHRWGSLVQRHIEHRAALVTMIVAVFLHVRTKTGRAALELHLAHQAALDKSIETVVNRG